MNSRQAQEDIATMPYQRLFAEANKEAQQAELFLLRNLLARSYNLLQGVAIEARSEGPADAMTEALMTDILTALDKRPALV
jgi:hypothetical protein